jgi:pyridoxine 5-phosphate synthase
MDLVLKVKPHQVTLVPDAPDALTSNAGWDCIKHASFLTEVLNTFRSKGIRTSLFIETDNKQIEQAAKLGTDRVELYTGPYAERYPKEPAAAIKPYIQAAETARKNGLSVNAGHDLNLHNLPLFYRSIPFTEEVSIGHALMVDALLMGLENSIKSYKNCLK